MKFNVNKLKGLMAENGLSQQDTAKLIGMSKRTFEHKIQGKSEFKASEIYMLATKFSVNIDYFFR